MTSNRWRGAPPRCTSSGHERISHRRQAHVAVDADADDFHDADWLSIHDYENFHGIRLGENESLNRVVRIAGALEAHGELFALLLREHFGDDLDAAEHVDMRA